MVIDNQLHFLSDHWSQICLQITGRSTTFNDFYCGKYLPRCFHTSVFLCCFSIKRNLSVSAFFCESYAVNGRISHTIWYIFGFTASWTDWRKRVCCFNMCKQTLFIRFGSFSPEDTFFLLERRKNDRKTASVLANLATIRTKWFIYCWIYAHRESRKRFYFECL